MSTHLWGRGKRGFFHAVLEARHASHHVGKEPPPNAPDLHLKVQINWGGGEWGQGIAGKTVGFVPSVLLLRQDVTKAEAGEQTQTGQHRGL